MHPGRGKEERFSTKSEGISLCESGGVWLPVTDTDLWGSVSRAHNLFKLYMVSLEHLTRMMDE